ncbi:hypothetical protein SUDANB145_07180 (plasmid) [Streptomyces sp. enrichment culture]|uniref:hypothetical protein n=1 Tax=Streptomyces sp. enrichment culture TaxID=1795815 RepID=UPI003F578398
MEQSTAYFADDGRSWRCDGCGSYGSVSRASNGHRLAARHVAMHNEECAPPKETVITQQPPAPAPFLLRLADGRAWAGAEYGPGGFVCVHHPDEVNICTIAVSLDALLTDRAAGDPLHGATVEHRERW